MIIHHTHKKLSDSLIKELYDNFTTDDCLVDDIYTTFRGVYSKHFPDEIENFYRKNLSIILTKLGLAGRVVVEELKWCVRYILVLSVEIIQVINIILGLSCCRGFIL